MNIKRKKAAVSEIVGVVVLLGMSIAMYSIVQFMVFSYPFEPATPSVNLVGSIKDNNISIGHFGGESLSDLTRIIIKINQLPDISFIVLEYKNNSKINFAQNPSPPGRDDLWEIGEILTYTYSSSSSYIDLKNATVHVTVIDVKTNSVVMMGYIKGGSS